ncbi:hypothetical protein BD410DRAFT_790127 [Rickenella mellea]|uniref:Ricin B lectin domain-containing protein n=1 Tax=Rickenella mellea TaxID=50990 RepID=A0A4Y7Q0A6_9AGAM|nr:hypothetical protein BD410DRAFT_790127 [Rickenella mellea]
MSIDPGAYEIQNVMHRNFALQRRTGVETYAESDDASTPLDGEPNLSKVWSISRLDNGKFSIRNFEMHDYAASPNFPVIEARIVTTWNRQQWEIKETSFKGRYVIYTTAASIDLFWGLSNGHLGTAISLRDTPNTPSNQWELKKVQLWPVVGALRAQRERLRDEHARLRYEHTKLTDKHTKLTDEHTKFRDEHATLEDEHAKLRDEHTKLQDKHTKLRDSVEFLDGGVPEGESTLEGWVTLTAS